MKLFTHGAKWLFSLLCTPDCIRPVHCVHKTAVLSKAAGFPIAGSGYGTVIPVFSAFRMYQGSAGEVANGTSGFLWLSPNYCSTLQGGAALGFSTAWWPLNLCLPTICAFMMSLLQQAIFHLVILKKHHFKLCETPSSVQALWPWCSRSRCQILGSFSRLASLLFAFGKPG